MMREAAEYGLEALAGAALGCLADSKYMLAVRRSGDGHTNFGRHLVLLHFSGSSVVGWPISLLAVPEHPNESAIEHSMECSEPSVFCCFDWTGIEAISYRWRPWSWQFYNFPGVAKAWRL